MIMEILILYFLVLFGFIWFYIYLNHKTKKWLSKKSVVYKKYFEDELK